MEADVDTFDPAPCDTQSDREPTPERPPVSLAALTQPLADWIGRHPGLGLGIAVGVGLGVGWIVKRR